MAASIKDVAKRAGVAISTVSKVINHYPGLKDETRKKVEAAIQELNYVPNMFASSLSSKQKHRIALLVFANNQRQAIDEINMLYLYGAFNMANELKIDCIAVFSSVIKGKSEAELVDYFQSQGIDALVVFSLIKENQVLQNIINKQLFKVVTVDAPLVNPATSSVMVNHRPAQYDVAKQTISFAEKCERVLYLAGRKDGWVTDIRLQGMQDLADQSDFELLVHHADFSERKAMETAIKYGKEVDVVVCASDLMAIGAVNGLRALDVFRPVCGYDGITLMGYVDYEMLTVVQDFYGVAQEAIVQVNQLYSGNCGQAVLMDYAIKTIKYLDIID